MGIAGLKLPELIILLLIIVIIFGVGKLPQIGGALGKSIREFRKSTEGVDEEVNELKEGEGKSPSTKA